ncbi:MAG: hypothetical protein RLZZ142_2745 [Verrucomicrobiota bacterium]
MTLGTLCIGQTGWRDGVPWGKWTVLGAIAVVGSCVYGASLASVVPGWTLGRGALWMVFSAGLAWTLLIPALWWWGPRRWIPVITACLVTMAWGEGVLALGAVLNEGALWALGSFPRAALWNGILVAVSNGVMATVLGLRMRPLGIPWSRTLTLWMGVLNGSGAVLFWVFFQLLKLG